LPSLVLLAVDGYDCSPLDDCPRRRNGLVKLVAFQVGP